ncbi:class II glutamine amidotransferase [Cyanobium sp. PCC 7001]|uniref:class II glutamine amidotransferase n=1 Tax=Cyanobium sp. PCC 7001 TaxID=180281 RepID=UPI000680D0C2|nr:class II glutamine amidotransferase [Cyanobium sp. PCC 7001]
MCELLGLNANTPTDMGFSFRGLSRRGGGTSEHADGWGLASFTPDGRGLTLLREEAPAAFSALAEQLAERSPRALVSIAHIRKATRGVVALENCHPFSRRWRGQTWAFAHNGDLEGTIPVGPRYRPFGSTDSEAAFCWILEQLDQGPLDPHDPEALLERLHGCAAALAERGTFNALISNGQWLFATATSRMHWLTRRAPFRRATLADAPLQVDFAALTSATDVVTILSTEPLTSDEQWQSVLPGESLLFRAGELAGRRRHAVRPAPAVPPQPPAPLSAGRTPPPPAAPAAPPPPAAVRD